jgi:hypothetical protein
MLEKRPPRRIALDLALYVLIGVSLVVVGALWFFLVPERFWPNLTHSWFTFIFMTFFLAVLLVTFYWSVRKKTKIWLVLALLMAIHIVAYTLVLRHVEDLPGAWYLLSGPLELMAMVAIVHAWTKVLPRKVDL